ncbi:MAG: Smr/MutS family protein [Alphaproteobacteria bacterium]
MKARAKTSARAKVPAQRAIEEGLPQEVQRRLKRERARSWGEDKLNLHDCTLAEAHVMVDVFLRGRYVAGGSVVLVVTGKGKEGKGKIREAFPGWLDSHSERVSHYQQASTHHGGAGAFYVKLRRHKRGR